MKGLPGGASGKEPAYQRRRLEKHTGSIPGTGRLPGEGNGNPLQYSCLEKPLYRGAWQATVHGVAKSQTQLKRLSTHVANENNSPETCRIVSNSTKLKKLALCKKGFLKNPTPPPIP